MIPHASVGNKYCKVISYVSRQEHILHVWLCHKYSRELHYAPRHIKISHKRLYNKYSKIITLCVKICHKSYMSVFVMITSRYYKNCQYMSSTCIPCFVINISIQGTSCSDKMYHNLNWQDGQILESTKSCYNLGNTNKCTNLQSVYSLYLILASIQNISRNEI